MVPIGVVIAARSQPRRKKPQRRHGPEDGHIPTRASVLAASAAMRKVIAPNSQSTLPSSPRLSPLVAMEDMSMEVCGEAIGRDCFCDCPLGVACELI